MWKEVILPILNFYRINIAKHYYPIHEAGVHLAPCTGITSLIDMLLLLRGGFEKIRMEKVGLGEKRVMERK